MKLGKVEQKKKQEAMFSMSGKFSNLGVHIDVLVTIVHIFSKTIKPLGPLSNFTSQQILLLTKISFGIYIILKKSRIHIYK